jgi:hypothetical protein
MATARVKISLCIPTMDRFDTFLKKALDRYLELLNKGWIDEIVVCDETGNDFYKINEHYEKIINDGVKLRVYKNTRRLGVFLNKMKVCKMANNDCIALIDSDNLVDESYFQVVNDYISKTQLTEYYILSPCFGRPHEGMNYSQFAGSILHKYNVRDYVVRSVGENALWSNLAYMWNRPFISFLNMGNFILSKNIMRNLFFDMDCLDKAQGCDVMYFNSCVFTQFYDYQFKFHIVNGLEYDHAVHDGSLQIKESDRSNEMMWDRLVPYFFHEVHK